MDWMALVFLHAVLTFVVLLLAAGLKLLLWLLTRRRARAGSRV